MIWAWLCYHICQTGIKHMLVRLDRWSYALVAPAAASPTVGRASDDAMIHDLGLIPFHPEGGSALLFLFNLRKIAESIARLLPLTVCHVLTNAPEHIPRCQDVAKSPVERPRNSPSRILAHRRAACR